MPTPNKIVLYVRADVVGMQASVGRVSADCGELLVSLCYQPANDRLTVIVLKARNLPRMDVTGLSGICQRYWPTVLTVALML